MTINFSRDIAPLYRTRVVTDPAYQAVDTERRSDVYEQNLLTLVDTVKGFMEEFETVEQARVFHYAMSRMLAATPFRGYEDVAARVCGNQRDFHATVQNGDAVEIESGSASDTVVIAFRVPPTNMEELVALINTRINATTIRAEVDRGRLCFVSPFGVPFTVRNASRGGSLLDKAGIPAGEYTGSISQAACQARDDALAHFQRVANPTVLAATPTVIRNLVARTSDDDEDVQGLQAL